MNETFELYFGVEHAIDLVSHLFFYREKSAAHRLYLRFSFLLSQFSVFKLYLDAHLDICELFEGILKFNLLVFLEFYELVLAVFYASQVLQLSFGLA